MQKFTRFALSLVLVGGLAAACGDDDSSDGGDSTTTTADVDDTTTTTEGGDDTTTTEGGGGGDADEGAYVDALSGTLQDAGADWTTAEADCMAAAIVDVTGADLWVDSGVTPDDIANAGSSADSPGILLGAGTISDDQADDILDGWEDCVDYNEKFAETLRGEAGVEDDQIPCIAGGLEASGAVREGFKQTFTQEVSQPDDSILQAIVTVFETCGVDTDAIN